MKPKLSQEYLKKLFRYDHESGQLWWITKGPGITRTKPCGAPGKDGYLHVMVDRVVYRVHRLIWVYHYGVQIPKGMVVDHINGIVTDNRIENIRLATITQNGMNRVKSVRANGTSSRYLGVFKEKQGKPWRARIKANGRRISLGAYNTEEEARDAYIAAKRKYHLFSPEVRHRCDQKDETSTSSTTAQHEC